MRTVSAALLAVVTVACSGGSLSIAPTPLVHSTSPRISRTRFLAFGDSLTAGTTSPAVSMRLMSAGLPQSYPFKLHALLTARYTTQTILVDNEGKPGERAEDGVLRLPGILRDKTPEIVILLHGVNDLAFLGPQGVPRTAGFLNAMVRDARVAGAQVVLCTLPPQRPGRVRVDPLVTATYNQAIRDVARGEGALLVDFDLEMTDVNLIGIDGLHPTEDGYARMAEMLFDRLRAQFEVSSVEPTVFDVGADPQAKRMRAPHP